VPGRRRAGVTAPVAFHPLAAHHSNFGCMRYKTSTKTHRFSCVTAPAARRSGTRGCRAGATRRCRTSRVPAVRLGCITALYRHASTLYQNCEHIRCLYF
jgi:hypothetical protein